MMEGKLPQNGAYNKVKEHKNCASERSIKSDIREHPFSNYAKRGGGGQKMLFFCVITKWMPPYYLVNTERWDCVGFFGVLGTHDS